MTEFTQVYLRPKQFLLDSSLAFILKEDPVRCAKVSDESWVILTFMYSLENWKPILSIGIALQVIQPGGWMTFLHLFGINQQPQLALPHLGQAIVKLGFLYTYMYVTMI